MRLFYLLKVKQHLYKHTQFFIMIISNKLTVTGGGGHFSFLYNLKILDHDQFIRHTKPLQMHVLLSSIDFFNWELGKKNLTKVHFKREMICRYMYT